MHSETGELVAVASTALLVPLGLWALATATVGLLWPGRVAAALATGPAGVLVGSLVTAVLGVVLITAGWELRRGARNRLRR
ncbi:MAG: hypothetical protein ABEJ31_10295 [Haloarculaceae archaeon]